jgi:sugar (pentulose or hexulose) kinase
LEEYVIGLDLGTQQIKILIVDREGNIVYNDTEVHPLPFSLQIGWAEQHPTDWWNTLIKLTKKKNKKDFI